MGKIRDIRGTGEHELPRPNASPAWHVYVVCPFTSQFSTLSKTVLSVVISAFQTWGPHFCCVRLSLSSANAATEQELLGVCYSERKYFHLSEAEGVSHLSPLI